MTTRRSHADAPSDPLVAAFVAWQPDAHCSAAGDQHAILAVRCYAAAGLSNGAIGSRLYALAAAVGEAESPEPWDAPTTFTDHCALTDLPPRRIVALHAYLANEVPCWPTVDQAVELTLARLARCREVTL